MKYWVDTDVFIQAKNLFYKFDQVPPFWSFLADQIEQGVVCCPKRVFAELTDGQDDLSVWCKARKNKLCVSPSQTINDNYKLVAAYVVSKYPRWDDYSPFLKGGDGWLVAHGMTGDTVVSHEVRWATKTVVKVPSVCDHFKVRCISLFDMNTALGFKV